MATRTKRQNLHRLDEHEKARIMRAFRMGDTSAQVSRRYAISLRTAAALKAEASQPAK